jgi:hypothetical protein
MQGSQTGTQIYSYLYKFTKYVPTNAMGCVTFVHNSCLEMNHGKQKHDLVMKCADL